MQRARKGEASALKEIYYRYDKMLYSICLRILNNKPEAQDTLQESFITAFKSLDKFSGEGRFDAWLKKITINKCLDLLRQRKLTFVDLNDNMQPEETEIEEEV